MKDEVMTEVLSAIDQIGEQIGEDNSEVRVTGEFELYCERMIANLQSLEFYIDKMRSKIKTKGE